MVFYPFEVTTPHIIYACLGGFIVLFGMFSLFLREKLYISEACWAFLFGVIIGPYCADIFNPRAWAAVGDEEAINVITLEFSRVILAIGVFAIGVELPKAYMRRHWKSLFFLLVPVMSWGWLVSAAFIYALIPGLTFLTSLSVAACLTPTDPILAAAVIGGKWADKHVPAHIRHLLAAESGCNDGAAFPFLFISLYLLLDHPNTGAALRDWFLLLWLYQVALGVVIGAALGFGFRHLMKFGERMDLIDRHSYVAQYVSLAIFTIGVTTLLGSDDLLSAFACGTAFAWDGFFNKQTEESVFSSVIDLLFNIAAFIYVGAWMPFNKFQDAELTLSVWRLLVIAILVLFFRRLPVMIAVYRWIPDVKNFREAVFCGHFGPIGIGAVFISTLAVEIVETAHKTPENASNYHQIEMLIQTIQPIVAFMVLCSITIHGLSIPSFSLGRRVHSVSRTWSRHATSTSTGAPPEWVINAPLVTRGDAKIVINRDRPADLDLERGSDSDKTREGSGASIKEQDGEGSIPMERLEIPVDGGDCATPAPQEVRFADSDTRQSTTVELQHLQRAHTPRRLVSPTHMDSPVQEIRRRDSDYRDEAYPDGGRVARPAEGGTEVTEWREGHQRIIERRAGPGDDVEVTAIHDPLSEDTGAQRLERRVSRELLTVAEGLHNLGHRAKEAMRSKGAGRVKRPRAGSTRQHPSVDKGKQPDQNRTAPSTSSSLSPTPPKRDTPGGSSGEQLPSILIAPGNENDDDDDDDEGWSSESSVVTSLSKSDEGKAQVRRTRIGGHFKSIVMGKRRRRQSVRREHDIEEQGDKGKSSFFGGGAPLSPHHLGDSCVSAVSGPSPRPRGMENAAVKSPNPSLGHSRVGRLVNDSRAPKREASPSRSIRFLDGQGGGGGNGTRTPRYGGGGTESV